jgi:hypothetical protein
MGAGPDAPQGEDENSRTPFKGTEEPGPPDTKPETWMTAPSHMVDNGDGTVTDPKAGLMWAQKDSYQSLRKWLNWHMAEDYLKKLNAEKFAGHSDWRFPTRAELTGLYDETKFIVWKYYWTTNEIHMDPVFGDPHCCVWSGENYDRKPDFAWGFNFIRGKTYLSLKDTGVEYSLTAVRPVRDFKPGAGGATARRP